MSDATFGTDVDSIKLKDTIRLSSVTTMTNQETSTFIYFFPITLNKYLFNLISVECTNIFS